MTCPTIQSEMVKYAGSETDKNTSRSQFLLGLDDICTIENLAYAFSAASRGKKRRGRVFQFCMDRGMRIYDLQRKIYERKYEPQPCAKFEIFCTSGQKVRTISAPAFPDTVVQHMLYEAVLPYFDRTFIFDSYGCRRGKGTHKAADRLQDFLRHSPGDAYYLQIDIRKYYYSINHEKLRESLARVIKDYEVLDLMMQFCKNDSGVGLNVGSLLSQLFGLIYLDRFDHWVKRHLKIRRYLRYVDDAVFIFDTKAEAVKAKTEIERYLSEQLGLSLSKWHVSPIKSGINFVGLRTWPTHRLIRKRSLHNFGRKLKAGKVESFVSILGHAMGTDSYRHLLLRIPDELDPCEIMRLPKRIRDDLAIEVGKIDVSQIPKGGIDDFESCAPSDNDYCQYVNGKIVQTA